MPRHPGQASGERPLQAVDITDDEKKILKKRADKNYFSLKEQVEDIIRRSCISAKKSQSVQKIKIDDRLVGIFSRERRGRKRKKK